MVKLTTNNQEISVPEHTTIMEAAEMLNIFIPNLCYLKDLNEIGACRVCVVEVEGVSRLVTSCNKLPPPLMSKSFSPNACHIAL